MQDGHHSSCAGSVLELTLFNLLRNDLKKGDDLYDDNMMWIMMIQHYMKHLGKGQTVKNFRRTSEARGSRQ